MCSGALLLLLGHAFIPIDEFIHRSDDAYYYFQVAVNYPELGFWSFDRIHPTNGVQPLWAIVLTSIAQLLASIGVTDVHLLARVFVACAAALHFASGMILFHLLARQVSVGTALASAGAFLFPSGIVWARVWGLENSLYAMMLLSAIAYFHLVFRKRRTSMTAAFVGALLGLTALARLNATLLVPCLLMYHLLKGDDPFRERLRLTVVAGAVTSALILPYFVSNYVHTGHLLPISGAVKALKLDQGLAARQIDSSLSLDFVRMVDRETRQPVQWFITSRAVDGLWLVGGRIIYDGAVSYALLLTLLSLFAFGPVLFGRPVEWLRFLQRRFSTLLPFSYVVVFGCLNAVISAWRYPFDIGYAGIRWWFVESEIIVVVLIATLVTASISYTAMRWIPRSLHVNMATAAMVLLFVFHAQQFVRFYWDGRKDVRDWNLSWNDESYLAAKWITANVPKDATVGSWNAGIVGYYSERKVVNLDGLINGFDLLPYLREDRIIDYIEREGLSYLSDMEDQFVRRKIRDHLNVTEVYRHHSRFMQRDYVIYRVDGSLSRT